MTAYSNVRKFNLGDLNYQRSGAECSVSSAKIPMYGSVELPKGVTRISPRAFEEIDTLNEVWLPEGLTDIEGYVFRGCSNLRRIHLPTTLSNIATSVFADCSSLCAVDISDLEAFCRIIYADAWSSPLCFARHLYLNGEPLRDLVFPTGLDRVRRCAFYNCADLQRVIIPEGVTEIDNWAFWTCDGIKEIHLPRSLKKVGQRAFWNCSSLTTIYYAGSGEEYSAIDKGKDNPILTSAYLVDHAPVPTSFDGSEGEDGLPREEVLSKDGFSEDDEIVLSKDGFSEDDTGYDITTPARKFNCQGSTVKGIFDPSLSEIALPVGCKSVADEAFKNNEAITRVKIPEGYTSIGRSAFDGCSNLTTVIIPPSVSFIDTWCFNNCHKLTKVIISDLASFCRIKFGDATGNPLANGATLYLGQIPVTHLDFPKGVNTVGECGIYNCRDMRSVILHDGVKSISNWGFWTCRDLEWIYIPPSVSSIGKRAFWECNKLANIYYGGSAAKWRSITVMEDNPILKKAKLHCNSRPEELEGLSYPDCEEALSKDDDFAYTDDYTTLDDLTYKQDKTGGITVTGIKNKNVRKIIIPHGLGITSLDRNCFKELKKVTHIEIPHGVRAIPVGVFSWCEKLEEVRLPSDVEHVNATAFNFCKSLKRIVLHGDRTPKFKSVNGSLYTKDGKTLIRYASGNGGDSFTVPDGVTRIEREAFNFCYGLKTVILNRDVRSIGDFAFCGCYDLEQITLPETLTQIGTWAFNFCSKLRLVRYRGGLIKWLGVKKMGYKKPFRARVVFK